MKRRTFILTTLAAALAVVCPMGHNKANDKKTRDALSWPEDLAELTDEDTIREIGLYYKQHIPSRYSKEKLRQVLLSNPNGAPMSLTSDSAIKTWLKEKIRQDFLTFNTITVKGWIISSTEFRQCALFSIL